MSITLQSQKKFINTLWLVFLLLCLALLARLPREEIPTPKLESVRITSYLPGASAERMDLEVGQRINDALSSMTEIQSIISEATYERSITLVEFKRSVHASDVSSFIISKLSAISDFPRDLEGPYTDSISANMWPDVTIAMTGGSEVSRAILWKKFESELSRLPEVGSLIEYGYSEPIMAIHVNPISLYSHNIRLDELSHVVENLIPTLSPGKLTPYASSVIHLSQGFDDATSLQDLALPNSGVRLGDLATVSLSTKRPSTFALHEQREAILVHIYKAEGARVDQLSSIAHNLAEQFNHKFSDNDQDVQLKVIYSKGESVKEEINKLFLSLGIGVFVVFSIIYLFLGLKTAFWSSMSIPFVIGAAVFYMFLSGVSLNMLSVFALILVIGMVVDDSIVVSEHFASSHRTGHKINSKTITKPVVVSSLTTIAAFFPVMFISGDAGEILSVIPAIVIVTLLASLVECFFILPAHLLDTSPTRSLQGPFNPMLVRSADLITKIVRAYIARPVATLVVFATLLISCIIFVAPKLEYALSNITEYQSIRITMQFDTDASLEHVNGELQRILSSLDTLNEGAIAFAVGGAKEENYKVRYSDAYAMFEVRFHKYMPRTEAINVAERIVNHIGSESGGVRATFELLSNAPPEGDELTVEVFSSDEAILENTLRSMEEFAFEELHIANSDGSHKNVVVQELAKIDDLVASQLGMSSKDIANILYIASNGKQVGRGLFDDVVHPIYLFGQSDAESLRQLTAFLTTPDGRLVNSDTLLTIEREQKASSITRRDGRRFMEFSANMSSNPDLRIEPNAAYRKLVDKFSSKDVTIKKSAQFEEIGEALISGVILSLVAVGMCYAILVFLFQSYVTPFLVLVCIPLSIAGGLLGVYLFSGKLAIADLMGIVGLFGIASNIAILWLDTYLGRRSEGQSINDAIRDTINLRTPAIMLTTLTTIFALLPTILAGTADLAGSMAKVVASGLAFSAIGTLFILPALVVTFDHYIQKQDHTPSSGKV